MCVLSLSSEGRQAALARGSGCQATGRALPDTEFVPAGDEPPLPVRKSSFFLQAVASR